MKLYPINKTNLDVYLYHYVQVVNKTSKLSRRQREYVLKQFEQGKKLGLIKEENGKIFKYVEKKNE